MGTKCPKCQAENPETQRFCGECGTQLPQLEEVSPSITKTLQFPIEELPIGSTFAGRYKIIKELGKGGMGKVYRALDMEVKEEVALKIIKAEIARDKAAIERFRNELKVARKVSHRNVCRMHDLGTAEEAYYITMEYVEGENLKRYIERSGKLPESDVIRLAKQICDGLKEAHELGVIHRDMKPQNIMIDKAGRAKIMDFGIARSIEAAGVTQTGVIIGTPDYISPEQAEGKEADQRSDIYSLGVILYEMVTGDVPFKGDTALSMALKHKSQLPQDPRKLNPDVSDDLARLILVCMDKDRGRRYQTAEALLNDLRNIEEGLPLGTKTRPRRATVFATLLREKVFIPMAIATVAIMAIAIWRLLPRKEVISPALLGRPSVAIMYFKNNTGDKSLDHLSESIPSQLTYDLMQSKYLYVLRNDRLIQIINKLDLQEKGNYSTDVLAKVADWGVVGYIIQGGYFKSGEDFRISIQILKAGSWETIGVETLSGRIDRQMAMVDELTPRIKSYFNLSARDIAADIDFDVGKVTTESAEALTNFIEGLKYGGKADWRTASELFKKAVDIDPQFAMAHSFLGWMYWSMAARAQARDHLEKALGSTERLSDRERFFVEAIYHHLLDEKPGNAAESLKKILRLYPEDWLANYMLGNLYLRLEEWEKARELFLVNRRNKVDFAENYRSLAEAYKYGGLYDEAIQVCEYALQNFSDTAFLRYELAQTYLCKRELDVALEEVNKAQLIHPFTSAYYGSLIWLKGNILMCQGDWPKAEQEFRRLLEMIDSQVNTYGYERLGHLFKTQGKLEDCIEWYKKGMEAAKSRNYPNWELSYRKNLVMAYLESGNLTEALDESGRMMLFAKSQGLRNSRLRFAYPFHPQFVTGYVCARIGAVKEAQDAADKLKIIVDNGLDRKLIRYYDLLMGMIEFQKENYKDAERYQERALSQLPFQVPYNTGFVDHAVFHNALAMTYLKLGKLDSAQEQYEKIISLTEGRLSFGAIYAKSYYMLGKILEQKGLRDKAIEHYERFLYLWKDADPDQPEVEDAKKRRAGLL